MGRHIGFIGLWCVLLLSTSLFGGTEAVKSLRIVSPLKALTIWDPETKDVEPTTARSRFLPIFKARLQAESEARKELKLKQDSELKQASSVATSGKDWAKNAGSADHRRKQAEERYIEEASDRAAAQAARAFASTPLSSKKNPNHYQFVGVINPKASSDKPIKWYARKKPAGSKWSVRLVHVDQAAFVTDMFRRGEVDIFAKYKNTGKINPETNTPVIESEYKVRERSFRNLWNFSPKHFFTDSSGMYWRERRVRPGLYTDGNMVYEATFRYRDGRNGMHQISSFQTFLASKGFSKKRKDTVTKRLKEDAPDIVLEE